MDLSEQDRSARKRHERAVAKGETCIDCHEGIAHKLPEDEVEAKDTDEDEARRSGDYGFDSVAVASDWFGPHRRTRLRHWAND